MTMKLDKKLKELKIKFVGDYDWIKFRDFMVLKGQECKTEENFTFLLKAMLGSCFTDADAVDEARKTLGLDPLSKEDRKKIREMEATEERDLLKRYIKNVKSQGYEVIRLAESTPAIINRLIFQDMKRIEEIIIVKRKR